MVAGGGEDFVGVGRHGECEFDLADFELAFAGVHDFGVLADEAGFVEFTGPDEFHMPFHVFGGDGDGWGLLWVRRPRSSSGIRLFSPMT